MEKNTRRQNNEKAADPPKKIISYPEDSLDHMASEEHLHYQDISYDHSRSMPYPSRI